MKFSLFTDRWIPVIRQRGSPQSLCSLEHLWQSLDSIHSIDGNPFLWMSIFRLLAALRIDDSLLRTAPWDLDCNPFLREFECSEDSAKPANAFLTFTDGNSVAWSPLPHTQIKPEIIAQSIVQTYFSDRPGLKARVQGFGVSGSTPPHIGKTSILRYGEMIEDLLKNNVSPEWANAEYEFLMHPWRQIKLIGDRMIVAPNMPYKGEVVDPWAKDSGRMKHIREAPIELLEDSEKGSFISITFCLKQAKILACDLSTFTKV